MLHYKELSKQLTNLLELKEEAVGIKLLTDNEPLQGYDVNNKYTFCQFIMKAREGNKLLAFGDNISCANGASALGFRPVPSKLMSGEFLSALGTFQQEGAKKTFEVMPRFEQNKYTGIALSPLSDIDFMPDIIILETVPEHLMWLGLATIHKDGGRMNFSSSISNGTCVDMTVVPQLTQKLNVSLGCYGCRNATNIPDNHLYAGFPGDQLESIVESLSRINEKAMPRTKSKKAYKHLINA